MRSGTSRTLMAACLVGLALAGCTQRQEAPTPRPRGRALTGNTTVDVRGFFDDYITALNRSDSTEVLRMYVPRADVTLAGNGRVLRGSEAIRKSAEETIFNPEQNTFSIDSIDVYGLGPTRAMALVVYKIEPPDADLSTFHTVVTYLLERARTGWQILHAHVSSDWVVEQQSAGG